ncbi:hypothetical protein Bca52824_092733 [Brassica carinata]|uniref:Uncharacterized protein n=1 Tax=Brassica carinata TaxID=52824 RepID=A0A8X7P742_BRACI|nr:hypothetical protein Bca52824_092733 [Brassica carinata]
MVHTATEAKRVDGDDSEGFETASEREISNEEDDSNRETSQEEPHQSDEAEKKEEQVELVREGEAIMDDDGLIKLKEVGNSILGRFGMSVDDFKAVKDPNTGSYSLSFQN